MDHFFSGRKAKIPSAIMISPTTLLFKYRPTPLKNMGIFTVMINHKPRIVPIQFSQKCSLIIQELAIARNVPTKTLLQKWQWGPKPENPAIISQRPRIPCSQPLYLDFRISTKRLIFGNWQLS